MYYTKDAATDNTNRHKSHKLMLKSSKILTIFFKFVSVKSD